MGRRRAARSADRRSSRRAVRRPPWRSPRRKAAKSSAAASGSSGPATTSQPTIIRANAGHGRSFEQETFAPILYVMTYETLDEAIAMHNGVPQGLSSRHLHRAASARPSSSSPPPAAIAASPTSTSAPAAPRSAGPSAAKKKPAAAAKRAATPGRPTCAGRPARSTTARDLPLAQEVEFTV